MKRAPSKALTPEDWMAAHGGPRRFESGASAEAFNMRKFLESKGYRVTPKGVRWKVSRGPGRPKIMGVRQLAELVDEFRRADGLEPSILREAGR